MIFRLMVVLALFFSIPTFAEGPDIQDLPRELVESLSPGQRFQFMRALKRIRADACKDSVADCLHASMETARKASALAKDGLDADAIVAKVDSEAPKKIPTAPAAPRTLYKVPVGKSHVRGNQNASVTLIVFSDYQCPFCKRAENTVARLRETYGDKLRVVMKHNPLDFHPRARPAAIAALAAGKQGKFWEMHDRLFSESPKGLSDEDFVSHAKAMGLDLRQFQRDLKSPALEKIIAEDQELATSLGARGTPTFFINGWLVVGAQPYDAFTTVIDEALEDAEEMRAHGLPEGKLYDTIIARGQERAEPAQPTVKDEPEYTVVVSPKEAPSRGPAKAKVTITMWTDFECPFCGRAQSTLQQIEKHYGKKVRIVIRHQPLPFHPNAKNAAEASMAAHAQGKFWKFHDLLFQNQRDLHPEALRTWARQAGLDMAAFDAAIEQGTYRAYVEADMEAGANVGASGTPTFFINGRKVVGAQPFSEFQRVIDQELAKK